MTTSYPGKQQRNPKDWPWSGGMGSTGQGKEKRRGEPAGSVQGGGGQRGFNITMG